MQVPKFKRFAATTGLFALMLLFGGVWVSASLFRLPDSVIVALAVAFAGLFIWDLIDRVMLVMKGVEAVWLHHQMNAITLGLLMTAFAVAYMQDGLRDTTAGDEIVHQFWPSLYLSVSTFTTLGYGDLVPVGISQPLAAIESLCGYLVLGLLASSGAVHLRQVVEKRSQMA